MSFEIISHEKWIEQIQKELKTADLSDKHVILAENLTSNPFFKRPEVNSGGRREEKTWKIKQSFDSTSILPSQITKALDQGVNYLFFSQAKEFSNPSLIFKDVLLEFVDIHLLVEEDHTTIKESLFKHFDIENSGFEDHIHFSTLNPSVAPKQSSSYFGLDPKKEDIDTLSVYFNSIISIADDIDDIESRKNFLSNIYIERIIGKEIVKELAINLVIHNVWNNILRGFGLGDLASPQLHAQCRIDSQKDQEGNYIELSAKAITAVLAGYDVIEVEPANQERLDFHHRISHNMLHIAQLENLLDKSSRGYRGSYQIDKLAEEMGEAVWDKIGRI